MPWSYKVHLSSAWLRMYYAFKVLKMHVYKHCGQGNVRIIPVDYIEYRALGLYRLSHNPMTVHYNYAYKCNLSQILYIYVLYNIFWSYFLSPQAPRSPLLSVHPISYPFLFPIKIQSKHTQKNNHNTKII